MARARLGLLLAFAPALTAAQMRSLVGLDVDFMNALGLSASRRA